MLDQEFLNLFNRGESYYPRLGLVWGKRNGLFLLLPATE